MKASGDIATPAASNGTAQVQAPSAEDLALYALQQKYTEEATKRQRSDGTAQFVELDTANDDKLRALARDPWVDHAALNAKKLVQDGSKYKFIIAGAGFGGMLYAVRLILAGLADGPDDILIVDPAGGFGGTWYWNRYPGLHCDIESYIYMPLLEETGYMPKYKYASGPELLEHTERIAQKWDLHSKALFRASVTKSAWDDAFKFWKVSITENRGEEPGRTLILDAHYFIVASGVFPKPHVPKIPGLASYSGTMFHTARWNYASTGGSDKQPELTGLEGKRVGILGTGATAIQVVPNIAKWAKEVYVFQRTPSAVTSRDQRPTDPEEWKTKIATGKGWQRARMRNYNRVVSRVASEEEGDLVSDNWTKMPAYFALIGSTKYTISEPTPEKIGAHLAMLYRLDMTFTDSVRARTEQIVKDPETAAKLKAWYHTWCKRPTFSDHYLESFNLPHVHLVDTDGKGPDSATETGLVVGGKEYPLDVLILSTGYRGPTVGSGNPAVRSSMSILGRDGLTIGEKWERGGTATLHGIATGGFPNFFFTPLAQAGQSPNYVSSLETWIEHTVQIVAEAEKKAGPNAIIEVTTQGEEEWSGIIMGGAAYAAAIVGCTPGYMTNEGEATKIPTDPLEMMKGARMAGWSGGIEDYARVLGEWRAEGSLRGLQITASA